MKNDPDVGKAADFSNSGGETKQAKTQGKAPYASFFKDNHIPPINRNLNIYLLRKENLLSILMRLIR